MARLTRSPRARRLPRRLVPVLLALAGLGCSGGADPTAPCTVSAIAVSPSQGTLRVGGTMALSASVTQTGCGDVSPTWSSGDPTVLQVSPAGMITALAPGGPVLVTARARGASGAAAFVVEAAATAVGSVTIAPVGPVSLGVGQTAALSVTVRDAAGAVLAGRAVGWATSNAAVATVSPAGVVTGVGVGQATVTATSEGRTGSVSVLVAPPTRQVTLAIDNQLIYPIDIAIDGVSVGAVPAQSTRSTTVPAGALTRVAWSLVRPTVGGRAIGDPMGGTWDLPGASGTVPLVVDNVVGGEWYFAPIVTNTSGTTLLMAVNLGLQAESRCGCTVPANGLATHLGYYRLYTNTIVAAFRDGSGYTGAYRFFSGLAPSVTRGSGRLPLTFSIAP